jgi:hypothetical protein
VGCGLASRVVNTYTSFGSKIRFWGSSKHAISSVWQQSASANYFKNRELANDSKKNILFISANVCGNDCENHCSAKKMPSYF